MMLRLPNFLCYPVIDPPPWDPNAALWPVALGMLSLIELISRMPLESVSTALLLVFKVTEPPPPLPTNIRSERIISDY